MGVTNYRGYYLFTKGDDPPSKNIKKRPKRIVLTVDGSKIQRSPVKVGSLSYYLYVPGGAGFLPA